MSSLFPDGVCVFACSGPSLNKVDCFSLGIPVVAISTAIRTINKPNYWVLADNLNQMHGEQGKVAWEDPSVIKVVAKGKLYTNKYSNRQDFRIIDCYENRRANDVLELSLFNPNKPLLRGPHKSITMAIQWAHINGAYNIIFAGNDLHADSIESKYSYPTEAFDIKKKHNFLKTLDQVKVCLTSWLPIAKKNNFGWYSWECGAVFESMVNKFEPSMLPELKKK